MVAQTAIIPSSSGRDDSPGHRDDRVCAGDGVEHRLIFASGSESPHTELAVFWNKVMVLAIATHNAFYIS